VPELVAKVKDAPAVTKFSAGTVPEDAEFSAYETMKLIPVVAAASPQFPPDVVLPFVNSAM
jgi:hypothetical protein